MGLGGGLANGRGTHEGSKDVAMNNEDQSMSLVESSLHTSNKKGNGARRPPKDSDATQKRGKSVGDLCNFQAESQ